MMHADSAQEPMHKAALLLGQTTALSYDEAADYVYAVWMATGWDWAGYPEVRGPPQMGEAMKGVDDMPNGVEEVPAGPNRQRRRALAAEQKRENRRKWRRAKQQRKP